MSDGAKHSLLSPSSSHRWIECPPSARLTENYPDTSSGYAQEGTLAHQTAEDKLLHRLGKTKPLQKCGDIEMDECTDDYVAFVGEQLEGLTEPLGGKARAEDDFDDGFQVEDDDSDFLN